MSHQPPSNAPKTIWRNLETKGEKMSSIEIRQGREARGGDSKRYNRRFGFQILAHLDGPHWVSCSTPGWPAGADYRYDRCGHSLVRGVSNQYEANAAVWRSICNMHRVLSPRTREAARLL